MSYWTHTGTIRFDDYDGQRDAEGIRFRLLDSMGYYEDESGRWWRSNGRPFGRGRGTLLTETIKPIGGEQ